MLEIRKKFNPIVEVFNPYSTPFTNQQESNKDNDQQTNCSLDAVQYNKACTACSACG